MKQIDNYIVEKLKLNKNSENDKNPFDQFKDNEDIFGAEDVLEYLVDELKVEWRANPRVYDDTKEWHPRDDDFENFDTTYGASIDWMDDFIQKTENNMVAIWNISPDIKDKVEKNEFVKFFKSEYDEELLYKKGGYYLKYWGEYKYEGKYTEGERIYISMIMATPGETDDPIICFVITDY